MSVVADPSSFLRAEEGGLEGFTPVERIRFRAENPFYDI